ncbi:MAG: hypothetical protein IJD28_01625 [Deferribacterales bacterium]|nr:hypothetical protein [Deferribacterales bacterium]
MFKNIILSLLLLVALSNYVFADDSEVTDIVNKLKKDSELENNKFQSEITDVYNTMKEGNPVEVSIPNYNVFAEEQKEILKRHNLPDIVADDTCVDSEKLGDYRVFVFISESVPEETLQNYMSTAKKSNDILLLMRGVIGSADLLKPTLRFMTKLACNKDFDKMTADDKCELSRLDINPLLFNLFNVKQVPAIVYSKLSYTELLIRENLGESLKNDEYYIIRGDIPLHYALEKFQEVGADVDNYLKDMKGSY